MNKNVLITGITGMLGSAVLRSFQFHENYQIYGVSRNLSSYLKNVEMYYGDLGDIEFIKTIKNKFDIIIHCSAEVNVDLCEEDKFHAYNSNVVSTKNLTYLRPRLIVYISTDSVFDGQTGKYRENGKVNPLNYYANTKMIGEQVVQNSNLNYLILRTNLYGFSQNMKNSLFEWAYKALSAGSKINGFSNVYFNPLYVGQIADLLHVFFKLEIKNETFHLGAEDNVSKYEFLSQIIGIFNFDENQLNSVLYDNTQFSSPRALNTTLDISKIKKVINNFNFSLRSGILKMKNDLHILGV